MTSSMSMFRRRLILSTFSGKSRLDSHCIVDGTVVSA